MENAVSSWRGKCRSQLGAPPGYSAAPGSRSAAHLWHTPGNTHARGDTYRVDVTTRPKDFQGRVPVAELSTTTASPFTSTRQMPIDSANNRSAPPGRTDRSQLGPDPIFSGSNRTRSALQFSAIWHRYFAVVLLRFSKLPSGKKRDPEERSYLRH